MHIYAISDLHLPGGQDKPMSLFGEIWENHFEKICTDWRARVEESDVVLIGGDICWAMNLPQALQDLQAIGQLPGKKVIIRGNHDYWWGSIQRLREALPLGMYALQNDALCLGDVVICGSRGWLCPNDGQFTLQDNKIYLREAQRMRLSLTAARKFGCDKPLIAMIHYPPLNDKKEPSHFTDLFEEYGVDHVIYGHLHGPSLQRAFKGERAGIRYHQTSCDGCDFKLQKILSV